MKSLLLLVLLFTASLAQAASPWETLTEKTLREGTRLNSNYGATKYLEKRLGNQVIYFTIELDTETDLAKNYSAVIETTEKTPDGKFAVDQNLFWFSRSGELAVTAHYRIILGADRSLESRQEITYGVAPSAADLALWENVLSGWAR